jgi:hypothetical protein
MLQLLHILDEKHTVDPGIEEFTLTKADKVELNIMENIAFFLTSRNTDVVAVTLHKGIPLTFVLAKNRGVPNEKDMLIAKEFFCGMRDASSWRDVMPCIISNGADRVNKMLVAVSTFQFEGILPGEPPYVAGELYEEFSETVADRFAELFNTRDPLEILKGLFHRVRDRANFEVDPKCTTNPDELSSHLDKFALVTATAECLLLTKFLTEHIDRGVGWALDYRTRVRQVSRYIQGITDLIGFRRRFILAGSNIHYVWLADVHGGGSEEEPNGVGLQLSDSAWTAIQNLSGSLRSYEAISNDDYYTNPKSPKLEGQWAPIIQPIRHVVPRMIFHLDRDQFYTAYPRLIGTSAQLCMCCALWLTEYDDSGGWRRKWKTSNREHGVDIGADWKLDGSAGTRLSLRADNDVYEVVRKRVIEVLKEAGLLQEAEVDVTSLAGIKWNSVDVAELLEDRWDQAWLHNDSYPDDPMQED